MAVVFNWWTASQIRSASHFDVTCQNVLRGTIETQRGHRITGSVRGQYLVGSVEAICAGLTVDTGRVLGTIDTHTPAMEVTMRVHAHLVVVHSLVVIAVLGLVVAVTF